MEVSRFRTCGGCGVANIPRGVDWGTWRNGEPWHSDCAGLVAVVPGRQTRKASVEDEADRVIDNMASAEWDVHVWKGQGEDASLLGACRVDVADRLRIVKRILDLSHFSPFMRELDEAFASAAEDLGVPFVPNPDGPVGHVSTWTVPRTPDREAEPVVGELVRADLANDQVTFRYSDDGSVRWGSGSYEIRLVRPGAAWRWARRNTKGQLLDVFDDEAVEPPPGGWTEPPAPRLHEWVEDFNNNAGECLACGEWKGHPNHGTTGDAGAPSATRGEAGQ